MTNEIPKEEWKKFFDDLSMRRFDWETRIEIFNEEIGNQVLDKGLPLGGITLEAKGDDTFVEIFIGNDDDHHQTHTIQNPTKVAYLSEINEPSGIIEFEEQDGTKTLLYIIRPMPIVFRSTEQNEHGEHATA